MNLSFVRCVRPATGFALLLACSAVSACSNSNPPPADAFVAAVVGPGAGDACNFATAVNPYVILGTATAGKPTTVADQGSTGDGTASVNCSVHPSGAGFDVTLSAATTGVHGGTMTIASSSAITTQGGSDVTGSFYKASLDATYRDEHCTMTFTYSGSPVSVSPAIAGGRVWGHVDCPHAVKSGGGTMTGPDGGPTDIACSASADFLFEQCGQ